MSDCLVFLLFGGKLCCVKSLERIVVYSSSVFILEDKSLECFASYLFPELRCCSSLMTPVFQGLDEEQSVQLLQCYLQEDYRGTRDSLKVCSYVQLLSPAFSHFPCWF